MDPRLNVQDTFQCQQCKTYVNKSCQQVHEANCQSSIKNTQVIINNKDVKPLFLINNQNQSKDNFSGFKPNPLKQISQIIPQQNNTGIQNSQKLQIPQFPNTSIQNFQLQDNQKNKNQQNQFQCNQPDLNSEGQFQVNRLFPKEQPIQKQEINNGQIPQQKFPQTTLIPQKNQLQKQILLPQQQQNSNNFQINSEKGLNQNQFKQQNQQGNFGAFQNQQQNQEQIKIFTTFEQKDKVNININQQQNIPTFGRIDNFQQKPIKINPPPQINNIFQNKNFQQFQPQQIQQQQQNIYNSSNIIQSPQFQNFTQQQNNRLTGNNQTISHSQPIQGQPYVPLQFPVPQIPQNIQPPPSIPSSMFPKFKNNIYNDDDDYDDDDDDDDDVNEYNSFNIFNRGLPNFDVNKQYSDDEVNRMNQEQVYQYFSNLYINENHGYSEDQINQKICQNFSMKLDDNRIDICVICQEEFTQETFTTDKQLPCSHLFHENCLIGWLKRSKQCPICKTEIEL